MTPHTHASATHFPADPPPEPQTVQSSLNTLNGWRQASAATAIVTAALLPFAISWHVSYLAAIYCALIAAASLTVCCQLTWHTRIASLAIHPQLAHLPELAHTRRRLVSNRSRRALAHRLRSTAAAPQPPARSDCWPLLRDRVAAERPQLLAIAAALEQAPDPDATCVALIRELLTDGRSPLYDIRVPAADLHTTLKRVRGGLLVEPHA